MASADNKRPFIAVMVKVFDSLDDGKQLLLSYAILLLGFVSCAAEIRNHLFEKAFVDVRVLNPCTQSNHQSPLASVYRRHEQEKRRQYEQRLCEVLLSPHLSCQLLEVWAELLPHSNMISEKRNTEYSQTVNWIHCKLRFALLRASIRSARSSRHHAASETTQGPIDLKLLEGRQIH